MYQRALSVITAQATSGGQPTQLGKAQGGPECHPMETLVGFQKKLAQGRGVLRGPPGVLCCLRQLLAGAGQDPVGETEWMWREVSSQFAAALRMPVDQGAAVKRDSDPQGEGGSERAAKAARHSTA